MLSGEGNAGERWKTTIGLISKKQLCTCSTLFLYISLPLLYCTITTWNFQKLLSYMFYGGNVARFLVHFFFHCRSFSPYIGGCLHFSFCYRRYKIFMLFFQQKNVSFVFYLSLQISVTLFLVELRWPAAYFLFFSVFLLPYIPNLWTWQLM